MESHFCLSLLTYILMVLAVSSFLKTISNPLFLYMLKILLFFMQPVLVMGPLLSITLLVLLVNLKFKFISNKWWWLILGEILIYVVYAMIYYNKSEPPRLYADNDTPTVSKTLAEVAKEKHFFAGTIANTTSGELYHEMVPTEFNSVTPANRLKWRQLLKDGKLDQYDFSSADELVDYAVSQGVRVRGHVLVWGQMEVPVDLEEKLNAANDPQEALKKILREHIFTTMRHFKGRIAQWDVLNEPMAYGKPELTNSIFMKALGEDYIDLVFRYAREADPDCKLFLNEQFWSYTDKRAEAFLDLLKRLKARGTPIDGIGLQGHINIPPLPEMAEMERFMDNLADMGYAIEITEIDLLLRLFIDADDPWQAQGDYAGKMVATAMRHPACTGITFWGISDKYNWYPEQYPFKLMSPFAPHLFDDEMVKKPAYHAVLKALQQGPNKKK